MSAEVFISYSSLDRDRVMPAVESLRGNGITVWVDEGNIHAADLWSEQIVQAIADCRVMVVMLSQNSTDSHNVVKEVMLASEQKKALLPVYLEPADIPAKLQYQLAGIQHLELYGENEQQVLEDLANGLAKRGIRREGEAIASQATTIKRHEKPSARATTTTQPKNMAKPIALALAVCVAVLLLMLFNSTSVTTSLSSDQSGKRLHLAIPIPEELPVAGPKEMPFGTVLPSIALSPNGDKLVYVCSHEKQRYLCLRSLRDDEFYLLEGTEGALLPFFDPSGEWIAFFGKDKLKKIELKSGLVKNLWETKSVAAGFWGQDGMIYFSDSQGFKFRKIPDNGGTPVEVMKDQLYVWLPKLANNGKGVVFNSTGIGAIKDKTSVYYVGFDSSDPPVLLKDGFNPFWFQPNKLITVEDGQIRSTLVNPDTFETADQSKMVAKSKVRGRDWFVQYAIAGNGTLAFLKGGGVNTLQLEILNPKTKTRQPLSERMEKFGQFSISPDGAKVAVEIENDHVYDIHVLDIQRGHFRSIVQTRGNYTPIWSADGNKLFYSSNRKGSGDFTAYFYDFKTKTEQELLFGDQKWKLIELSDVSRDGKYLLYFGRQQGDLLDNLYYFDLVDDTNHQLTNEPTIHEWGQVISYDGKWLAYTSEKDSKGFFEIYINRFPEMDQEIRISKGNGEEPKWLPDGSGVYYRNGLQWMKVPLKLSGEPEIGEPEVFFEGEYVNVWGPSHDIFPDGRILLLKGEEWIQPTKIDVIINALEVY